MTSSTTTKLTNLCASLRSVQFMHGKVNGKSTTIEAVANFIVEVIISFLFVSPIFIFLKFVVIPSITASLVLSDVKKAKLEYNKAEYKRNRKEKKEEKRGEREREQMPSIVRKLSINSSDLGVGGLNIMKGFKRGSTSSMMRNKAVRGMEVEMEMVQIKEMGVEVEEEAVVDVDVDVDVDVENPIGRGSRTLTIQREEELEETGEEWSAFEDEATGHQYFVSNLSGRTTWTPHSVVTLENPQVQELEEKWETLFDEVSGYNYYINQVTRKVTWTKPPEEVTADWSCSSE